MWKERTEKKKFEEGFGEDVKEIYALTQDDVGSCRMKGECCWTASIRLLAYVDVKTAELDVYKRQILSKRFADCTGDGRGKALSAGNR